MKTRPPLNIPGYEGTNCDSGTGAYPYGEVLQQSFYFYEAQQSGKLPDWNRVSWRNDSTMTDGDDIGIDLTGGWFEAGNHVKFGYPMAAAITMLACGGVDYRFAYERAGQMDELLRNVQFVTDYFIQAHLSPNELVVQVGDPSTDHKHWGPPENIDFARPTYTIDLSCPGVDVAAETAAAMAASSLLFRPTNPDYAATLLSHAEQLFNFARLSEGEDGVDNSYSNCVAKSAPFYDGRYGVYWDELAWAAVWLYRATEDASYLALVDQYNEKNGLGEFHWTQSWNDKIYGVYALMATLTGDTAYQEDTERWLDHWYNGDGQRTDGGLMLVDSWGTLRYAANTAFIAHYYADRLNNLHPKKAAYQNFAAQQIDYMLGDNPRQSSYVVGYGVNPPLRAHHRAASGLKPANSSLPNVNVIYGALVGGPDKDDAFIDSRPKYKYTEVTIDYNAGFSSALAALYWRFGGDPFLVFP